MRSRLGRARPRDGRVRTHSRDGPPRRPRRIQMTRRSTRTGVLALVGLLALALWPSVARAQAPAAQDTLQAVIKRGELIVGTFDFFPPWGFRDAQNNIVGMDVDI